MRTPTVALPPLGVDTLALAAGALALTLSLLLPPQPATARATSATDTAGTIRSVLLRLN